jgi:hypothetical protein
MPRFRIQDIHALENSPTSASALRSKVGEMIVNSTIFRAKVDSVNPDTWEYRIVLEGTLDREATKFEES